MTTAYEDPTMIVEFDRTIPFMAGDHSKHIARVWKGPRRGKPFITLVGDGDFASLLECMRIWDSQGRPSIAEAQAQVGTSTQEEA